MNAYPGRHTESPKRICGDAKGSASSKARALEPLETADRAGERGALPFAEQFALWAMRLWVAGQRGQSVEHALDGAFRRLHQPQARRSLELFMLSLAHGAIRPIRLWPPCAGPVSDDEARLLDMLRYSQAGETFAPAMLCRSFLRPRASAVAGVLGADFADCLAKAGLRLPVPGVVTGGAQDV